MCVLSVSSRGKVIPTKKTPNESNICTNLQLCLCTWVVLSLTQGCWFHYCHHVYVCCFFTEPNKRNLLLAFFNFLCLSTMCLHLLMYFKIVGFCSIFKRLFSCSCSRALPSSTRAGWDSLLHLLPLCEIPWQLLLHHTSKPEWSALQHDFFLAKKIP